MVRPTNFAPGQHGHAAEHNAANTDLNAATAAIAAGFAGIIPFSRSGTLMAETFPFPYYTEVNCNVLTVRASVGTAPTGGPIVVDVLRNGITSLWTNPANRPTIAAGAVTNLATPSTPGLLAADFVTIQVVQVGSTTPGMNLIVTIQFSGGN